MDRLHELEELERELDRIVFQVARAGGWPEVEAMLRQVRRRATVALAPPRPRVAILGASTDRRKYGNKAVRAFRQAGFDVFPINPNADRVEGLKAFASLDALPVERLDRVSVYVPAEVALRVLDQVARKHVGEVWLNPGSESPELVARAEALGLNVIQACSILDVGAHPDRV